MRARPPPGSPLLRQSPDGHLPQIPVVEGHLQEACLLLEAENRIGGGSGRGDQVVCGRREDVPDRPVVQDRKSVV